MLKYIINKKTSDGFNIAEEDLSDFVHAGLVGRPQWILWVNTWCQHCCSESNWTAMSSRHLDDTTGALLFFTLQYEATVFVYLSELFAKWIRKSVLALLV